MSTQVEAAETRSRTRDLRDFISMLRRYWVGELLILLATIAVVAVFTALQPRVYSATASGLTQAASGESLSMALAGDTLAKSRAETYVRIATSDAVAKRAATALGAKGTGGLLGSIRANLPSGTAVIEITASANSPDEAAKLANVWVQALADQVKELEAPKDGINDAALSFAPLAAARAPYLPSSPNLQSAFMLALAAGLALAFVYGLLRNHFDRKVRSVAQIEALIDAPVIGIVPSSDLFGERLRVVDQPESDTRQLFAITEALRELRTNLSYVNVDRPPRVIVITSSIPGEGKSTLASNLADAIAAASSNVVLIDCDLRRPTQSGIYSLRGGVGLTDVLSGRLSINDAMQAPGNDPHLRVLGSGRIPPNPSELLGSRTMKELVEALAEVATVILDAPPVLSVTDAAVLSTIADGVVLTVAAKQVTSEQLEKSFRGIVRVRGRVLGAVLNKVPSNGIDAYDYGYYRSDYYYTAKSDDEKPTAAEAATSEASDSTAGEMTEARDSARGERALARRRAAR
ncbi:polysaccharide biosynthesis tyrosine autokinase [Leifsonia sp. TF02-11]|uniref:polysaccharide biosynthesis tyrosine autokinase n=1 Tax=Leifsonia sp. TF02-11 TaxID=2815212 RepID=UPI001AA0F0AA|nr:polysaccharide biosynthesis tyrosine autokinase [Leifsonia sp. TF02-11]MBO1740116.1 polysaccharide biosynthesis tyrosine autokinase [Leifsonia sp. TF02-11]